MMRKCWETEQESRPTFQDIYDELKKMLSETDHVRTEQLALRGHVTSIAMLE